MLADIVLTIEAGGVLKLEGVVWEAPARLHEGRRVDDDPPRRAAAHTQGQQSANALVAAGLLPWAWLAPPKLSGLIMTPQEQRTDAKMSSSGGRFRLCICSRPKQGYIALRAGSSITARKKSRMAGAPWQCSAGPPSPRIIFRRGSCPRHNHGRVQFGAFGAIIKSKVVNR